MEISEKLKKKIFAYLQFQIADLELEPPISAFRIGKTYCQYVASHIGDFGIQHLEEVCKSVNYLMQNKQFGDASSKAEWKLLASIHSKDENPPFLFLFDMLGQ